jgi:hypothetical protein
MRYLIEDSGGFLNQALRNEALNRRLFRLQEAHRHKRAHQRQDAERLTLPSQVYRLQEGYGVSLHHVGVQCIGPRVDQGRPCSL